MVNISLNTVTSLENVFASTPFNITTHFYKNKLFTKLVPNCIYLYVLGFDDSKLHKTLKIT